MGVIGFFIHQDDQGRGLLFPVLRNEAQCLEAFLVLWAAGDFHVTAVGHRVWLKVEVCEPGLRRFVRPAIVPCSGF